ncbi:hypothetical protein [Ammoniphilus sp. CFH 90114]|uniref:hypothetical protein n=1 Tax=Ammoniphilus sp. CFH 90114 TaxID=2493665 RepID=UPI00100FE626|nr:hypothetical protein [Ammoniphilus sp. CFH 90114]RXT08939.1 hypothetical protein EIZ39_09090 [Ammoniphilus sp. CFH 90114]
MSGMDDQRKLKQIEEFLDEITQVISECKACLLERRTVSGDGSLEREFFSSMTQVYAKEEELRKSQNNARKSNTRITTMLYQELALFFQNRFPSHLQMEPQQDVLLLKQNEDQVGVIKIIPNLSSYKGMKWYIRVNRIVSQAKEQYQVAAENIYFIVGNLLNGLDSGNVQQKLGTEITTGNELLKIKHRKQLLRYLDSYVLGAHALPRPREQVYFLSATLSPNEMGKVWMEKQDWVRQQVEQELWIRPSISELISTLQEKYGAANS